MNVCKYYLWNILMRNSLNWLFVVNAIALQVNQSAPMSNIFTNNSQEKPIQLQLPKKNPSTNKTVIHNHHYHINRISNSLEVVLGCIAAGFSLHFLISYEPNEEDQDLIKMQCAFYFAGMAIASKFCTSVFDAISYSSMQFNNATQDNNNDVYTK